MDRIETVEWFYSRMMLGMSKGSAKTRHNSDHQHTTSSFPMSEERKSEKWRGLNQASVTAVRAVRHRRPIERIFGGRLGFLLSSSSRFDMSNRRPPLEDGISQMGGETSGEDACLNPSEGELSKSTRENSFIPLCHSF